jgi:hypothetical protein
MTFTTFSKRNFSHSLKKVDCKANKSAGVNSKFSDELPAQVNKPNKSAGPETYEHLNPHDELVVLQAQANTQISEQIDSSASKTIRQSQAYADADSPDINSLYLGNVPLESIRGGNLKVSNFTYGGDLPVSCGGTSIKNNTILKDGGVLPQDKFKIQTFDVDKAYTMSSIDVKDKDPLFTEKSYANSQSDNCNVTVTDINIKCADKTTGSNVKSDDFKLDKYIQNNTLFQDSTNYPEDDELLVTNRVMNESFLLLSNDKLVEDFEFIHENLIHPLHDSFLNDPSMLFTESILTMVPLAGEFFYTLHTTLKQTPDNILFDDINFHAYYSALVAVEVQLTSFHEGASDNGFMYKACEVLQVLNSDD